MSGRLCSLLKGEFDYNIRQRGEAYFREQRVRIRVFEQTTVLASVRGSSRYNVELGLKTKDETLKLFVDCDCPYFQDLGLCKHVWATLLQADAEGLLQPPDDLSQLSIESPVMDDVTLKELSDLRELGMEMESLMKPVRSPKLSGWRGALAEVSDFAQSISYMMPLGPTQPSPPVVCELRFEIPVDEVFRSAQLAVRPMMRSRRQTGQWGKWKPVKLGVHNSDGFSHEDYLLVAALIGESTGSSSGYVYDNRYAINMNFGLQFMPKLCATGRLFASHQGVEHGPLAWDAGGAWTFRMEIASDPVKKDYGVQGFLIRGDEKRSLTEPLILMSTGWIIWPDRISLLENVSSFAWIMALRQQRRIAIPHAEGIEFAAALLNSRSLPPLSLPAELDFTEVKLQPMPCLTILSQPTYGYHPYNALPARMTFDYGGREADGADETILLHDIKARQIFSRCRETEKAAWNLFFNLGGRKGSYYTRGENGNCEIKVDTMPKLVSELVTAGWQVKAKGKLYRKPGKLEVTVQSGVDWFDLQVKCHFDGKSASMPALLAALRKQEAWVKLDDGSYGLLPEEWLHKYGMVATLGAVEGEAIRFKSNQAGLLDVWLAAQPEVCVDEVFARVRQEWGRFESIAPEEAPSTFHGTLRPYQKVGLGWLGFLQRFGFGGCLADDMGLGKTVQVLALLEKRRALKMEDGSSMPRPSLVVAPRSLVLNWQREAAQFTPQLRVLDHTGADRMKDKAEWSDYDLILTTYGTLRKDIGLLKGFVFDYIVLDESQAIKNAGAQTAKAVRLLQSHHRLALSGTPIENHLGELWSLFEFLNPGLLGTSSVFGEKWAKNPDPEACALLSKSLRPFILRRTKAQVAPDLPARQEETLYCELPAAQRKLYDELRMHYRQSLLGKVARDGLNQSKIQVLEALLRLRQAACHPGLLNENHLDAACAKLETLLPQLQEVIEEGHKALVFSQFTSFLSILRTQLDGLTIPYEYLDGQTRHRQQAVDHFQTDEKCPLFLISLKAGGLGLNLTAAEYVFLLDPWWNPAVEAQAIDRAHRIGQVNKVFAYRLIAKDTIEEKVLVLQESKRELAAAVITQDNALLRNLTREDLEFLLA
jgi:hypothetical protein